MPVPPKPEAFDPDKSVPGVEIKFVTFLAQRPKMVNGPRSLFVHTNGARGEGTVDAAWNWSHARPGVNTCPHYQVDRTHGGVTRARKMLPSNVVGIGNGTVGPSTRDANGRLIWPTLSNYERASITTHGNISRWSIVIETADQGWPNPGHAGGFDDGQIELIAQVIAYESILGGYPIEYPEHWWSEGVGAHTEPHTFPFTTTVRGKPCPGDTKKRQLRDEIMPRAREIRAAWEAGQVPSEPAVPRPVDPPIHHPIGADPMKKYILVVRRHGDPQRDRTTFKLAGGILSYLDEISARVERLDPDAITIPDLDVWADENFKDAPQAVPYRGLSVLHSLIEHNGTVGKPPLIVAENGAGQKEGLAPSWQRSAINDAARA